MPLPSAAQIKEYGHGVFDAVADASVVLIRDVVARLYAAMTKAPDYATIVALHTCHVMWLSPALGLQNGGQGGPVTSAAAGAVSMSFAVNAVDADSLQRSEWGILLAPLLVANGPYVATGRGPAPRWRGQ